MGVDGGVFIRRDIFQMLWVRRRGWGGGKQALNYWYGLVWIIKMLELSQTMISAIGSFGCCTGPGLQESWSELLSCAPLRGRTLCALETLPLLTFYVE